MFHKSYKNTFYKNIQAEIGETRPYTRHQSRVGAVAINREVKMSKKLTKLSWIFLITDCIDLITDWIDLITDWIDIITDKIIKKWLKS